MDMKNKRVALVTGATGGLGTAMCKKLCDDGFHVVANYRNRQKADDWYAAMRTDGYDIDMFEGDVCDFESVKRMILEIETKIGGIDVLVNNAGTFMEPSVDFDI